MKQDKKLTLYMAIFFLIIFVSFGVIITTEKLAPYSIPKIDKKLNNYLKENYPNILEEVNIKDTIYKNTVYTLKVVSKENKNLYFTINYQNKKITDTYKKDYLEGNTLLTKITKKLEKNINKISKEKITIEIPRKLNDFSTQVRKRLIEEKDLSTLKIYNINLDLEVEEFSSEKIENCITTNIEKLNSKNITPKSYNITITNKSDITESVKINNITEELVKSSSFKSGINDIINNKESDILNKYNITYKYLN